MTWKRWSILMFTVLIGLLFTAGCPRKPDGVVDEARAAGRSAESLIAADEDYFHDMDGGVTLSADEVKGRNNWIVWTAGNDHLWDTITKDSVGAVDFLKTISSHRGLKFSRDNRWNYLGLVNEPCFEKATEGDPKRFGLWLDKRSANCPPDPFENEQKYPGVKIGARGKNIPAGSFYGYATGIVGLRLFPNPDFDDKAQAKWNAEKFYNDKDYYNSKDLVRPYRIGMSCGFCHVGPNPIRPPADPEHPQWANLSSNVGAQYFWIDRIFDWNHDDTSFVSEVFHTSRPGALDTSLISSDNINNPRTMNAVYGLKARLQNARRWGKETIAGGGKNNKQFNDYPVTASLNDFFKAPDTVLTPRVLKDGADSVGALGALNRVFFNIGQFSEEWLRHFNPLIGGKKVTPIEIAVARKNSSFFEATETQTPLLALFFLKTTDPHKLKDAPGGDKYLTKDKALLNHGKEVFAERCARCHSSKIPTNAPGLDAGNGCAGPGYLNCWNQYWAWTKTPEFKAEMKKIVLGDDFLTDNFLSTELRVPVTLLETNACSPLATNGIGGNIWDNFTSQSYKDLPSVGSITVVHPYTGEPRQYQMPAGGRGYTRPASLLSVWSTAPFLLNNTVGKFDQSPSVEARMKSFQNSIEQMLWPERRDKDSVLGAKGVGLIDRTTVPSYLRVAKGYLPDFLAKPQDWNSRLLPQLFGKDGIEIGPIPAGTPINLLSNLDLLSDGTDGATRIEHDKKVFELLIKLKLDLKALPAGATDADARRVFANLVDPLLALNKCPDFVVNRGHYFGTSYFKEEPGLTDADKRALIEFVKTF